MKVMTELRKRDDGWHGVLWLVDDDGNPVGDQQMEWFMGTAELGARLGFNLYIAELAKRMGWTQGEELEAP